MEPPNINTIEPSKTNNNSRLYRIYIDEVGNHDLNSSKDENERYLTLFGVWMSYSEVKNKVRPDMDAIKRDYFQKDPDQTIIFHRKQITRFEGDFTILAKKEVRDDFGNCLLKAFKDWNYVAMAVTIDKRKHLEKYNIWHYEPYHYCFEVLLERYVLFLHYRRLKGDVMVESRSTKPDKNLKNSYRRFYGKGTTNISAGIIQNCLTTGELKCKKKGENICGLQLADLLAHPAHYDLLNSYGVIGKQNSEFGVEVGKILRDTKYNRHYINGKIDGFGTKLLP